MTVRAEERLARAAQLMTEHEVAHLVVVHPDDGHPIGILSTLDVAGVLAWGGTAYTAGPGEARVQRRLHLVDRLTHVAVAANDHVAVGLNLVEGLELRAAGGPRSRRRVRRGPVAHPAARPFGHHRRRRPALHEDGAGPAPP